MKATKLNNLSFEAYLQIEQQTNLRYEFHDGTITAMAGGTVEHGLIAGNLQIELALALRAKNKNCRPLNSDVKLHIAASNKYVYPDGMLICDEIEKSSKHAVTNPIIIIEVLSESTEGYDRGDKFFFYKQVASLQEYILVDQRQAVIDIYTKKTDLWKIARIEGLSETLRISSLGIDIGLEGIYRDVLEG